jgi:hypothetical protein
MEKITIKPNEGGKNRILDYTYTVITIFANHITIKQDYVVELNELEDEVLNKVIEVKNIFTIPKQHISTLWLSYDSKLESWAVTIETANQSKDLGMESYEIGKGVYDKLYKWLYS